jgi:hypothetical protein
LPRKLPPELGTLLADKNTDKEHDPYAQLSLRQRAPRNKLTLLPLDWADKR